jgi:hypothetical protein
VTSRHVYSCYKKGECVPVCCFRKNFCF